MSPHRLSDMRPSSFRFSSHWLPLFANFRFASLELPLGVGTTEVVGGEGP